MNKFPNLCDEDFDSLIKAVSLLSSEYTPEWDFDLSGDDFGSTFSKVFCQMQEDTVDRLNKSVRNIYFTILRLLGVSPLLCNPSKVISFIETLDDSGVHFIKKGTKINAYGKTSDVLFETSEDVFVSDNSINSIFMSDVYNKQIVKIFDDKKKLEPFKIFNFENMENMQKRCIYIFDDSVFDVFNNSIVFKFDSIFSRKDKKRLCDIFYDSKWEFFNGESWVLSSFLEKIDDNSIRVGVAEQVEKFNLLGNESRYFRISVPEGCDVSLSGISYISDEIFLKPDELFSGEEILDQSSSFFPFKEKFYLYDIFIIKCNEAFNKPGANISISTNMSFVKVSSDFKSYIKNYKMIMSDIDFAETEPMDINIENVTWEYWKENSWVPLKISSKDGGKFFYGSKNSEKRFLEFVCPNDITETTIGPDSGLFIRARISKMGNQYSNYFNYVSPCLSNFEIKYSYSKPRKCEQLVVYSDLEYKKIKFGGNNKEITNFFDFGNNKNKSLYFNLSKPISDGILNLFFNIEESVYENDILLKWEYWGRGSGDICKWKTLHVIDYTNGLSKSGIVKILSSDNFSKTKLFGQDGFFLRVSQVGDNKVKYYPIIKDIRLNAVEIVQKETVPYEYFFVNDYEKNKVCSLPSENKNIFDIEVWIDEKESVSSSECAKISYEFPDDIEIEKSSDGIIKKIWIKWKKIDNILSADSTSRVYEFNSETSQIKFGDGKYGKLPSEKYGRNIRVKYCTSNGENGNINENSIKGFDSSVPYVSSIYNIERAFGGADVESLDCASERTLAQVSMGSRLISCENFEKGIRFNDRKIFRVKCFSHIDKYEKKNDGYLTVVILPKDYMRGLRNFFEIKNTAINFIKNNAPIRFLNSDRIHVIESLYVKFSFKIISHIDDFHKYQIIYDEIVSSLKKFLDPITGGKYGKGFNIGVLPSENDILNVLKFIDEVYIDEFEVFTKVLTEYGEKEVLPDEIRKSKFTVPVFEKVDLKIKF